MKLYIAWKTSHSESYIVDIYKSKSSFSKEYCLDDADIKSKNILLKEFSAYGSEKDYFSEINVADNAKHLYLMEVNEDHEGGSYYNYIKLYVSDDINAIYEIAIDHIDDEHMDMMSHYDSDINKDDCEKKFLDKLKKKSYADILCAPYVLSFKINKISIP